MRQRSDEAIKDEAFDLFYKELLKASKDLYQKLLYHNIAKKNFKKKKRVDGEPAHRFGSPKAFF